MSKVIRANRQESESRGGRCVSRSDAPVEVKEVLVPWPLEHSGLASLIFKKPSLGILAAASPVK